MTILQRRDFITLLGGAAALSSLSPRKGSAQRAIRSVIGFLQSGTPEAGANIAAAFRKGLSEGGYDEGRNLVIDYRWAHNDLNRLPGLAADLVRRRVSVIATLASSDATSAAKAATATIPIVFSMGADPVQIGLVAALNRPGGNLTGISTMRPGKAHLKASLPAVLGENPPYGMIGGSRKRRHHSKPGPRLDPTRPKPIPYGRLASLRSLKHLRAWVGPTAATCGSTFVGPALTTRRPEIRYRRSIRHLRLPEMAPYSPTESGRRTPFPRQ